MMDWQRQIVRRTMEGAGDQPGAQIQFLLQRPEAHPEALPAIANAVADKAVLQEQKAEALRAETLRRNGGAEITELQK